MGSNQRLRPYSSADGEEERPEPGILNERILLLVFERMKWDLLALCSAARVNRKLRAIAKRILWRELCIHRAPRMVAELVHGLPGSRIGGGWHALAKLLFFCCGCQTTKHFPIYRSIPGHFVKASRFSKTSGRSFLSKKCRGDLLYVSDPCEHVREDAVDDVGVYRGVFRGFMRSKTRACLIERQIQLEERIRCAYCGARVWSMTTAKLVPKSASKRLGTHQGGLEYFVCINGHLHGTCWLLPLTSDEDRDVDDEDEEDCGGDVRDDHADYSSYGDLMQNGDHFRGYESTSSAGDDVFVRDSKCRLGSD